MLLSYPASTGEIDDFSTLTEQAKSAGCFCIMACDLLALTILKAPGELGADMAIDLPSVLVCQWAMAAPCSLYGNS